MRALSVLAGVLMTCAVTCALAAPAVALPDTTGPAPDESADLYLVTLAGPGTAGRTGSAAQSGFRARELTEQDAALDRVAASTPVYRWTTALNGFAVRLTAEQADELAAVPDVVSIERNTVRRLAGIRSRGSAVGQALALRGGAGVVIGMVDTGLWPDSPLFADVRGLGRPPRGFHGACDTGPGWAADVCGRKVVAAHWFVDGFGTDRLRASASLSPLDDDGHGTLTASVAAGNPRVSVHVPGQRTGLYSGIAPQARLAIYKACWTAPDPRHDGCATADLVSAIDTAVAEGVDVLNLSVDGPPRVDTVERALLGAAEADVVVVGASGNRGAGAYAAHDAPWVTSVGGTTGSTRSGTVLGPGLRLTGAMAARRATRSARLVVGARVPAPSSTAEQAKYCVPGSLDAARVTGRIVLCDRGRIGRVDKSQAVRRADGVGMVLANVSRGQVIADFQSVPTVHLTKPSARALRSWLRRHPDGRVSLRPGGVLRTPDRLVAWTSSGDPRADFLKPDVVATGTGVLGASPPSTGHRWGLGSGTSLAAARVSGIAAVLLGRHEWTATEVRSALATTAGNVAGNPSLLRLGSGRARGQAALRPGLVFDTAPDDYRAWLDGTLEGAALNTPSLLARGDAAFTRTVTNVGTRGMYYSSSARGFARHQVRVTPAALNLLPGQSATFTVTISGSAGPQPLDDGWVLWRGANGLRVRLPVVIAR